MAESMQGLHRSHRCTEVSNQNIGETVTVMGWVQKRRNLGSLIFIHLRDRSGILQLVFNEESVGKEGYEKAERLRSEYVICLLYTSWKIEVAGKIDADIAVTKDDEFPDLPRFGVRMFLDKKLSAVRYFGMGPQESYCDKHQAASHGLYRADVGDLHEDYIRPQENGSHYDCEYVELNNCLLYTSTKLSTKKSRMINIYSTSFQTKQRLH